VEHYPLLSIGGWLYRDLAGESGQKQALGSPADIDGALLLVGYLNALAEISSDGGLEQWAAEQSSIELTRLFAVDDAFWSDWERESAAARPPGRWSTATKAVVLAAAHASQSSELAPQLIDMTASLAEAFEFWDDLSSVVHDLGDGRQTVVTKLLAPAAQANGSYWQPVQLLGALITTNALDMILSRASERLAKSRQVADELGLRTVSAYLSDVAISEGDRRNRLATGRGEPASFAVSPSVISLPPPPIEHALHMAERSLRADPTLRESWETHREGMLGAPEVSSRFPAALVLEILARHGNDVHIEVQGFSAWAEENEFRYYDHPGADPDADTLGAALRLRCFQAGAHIGPNLRAIVECVGRFIVERGELPVWLTACGANGESREILRLGEGCATVVAHLLIGLLESGLLPQDTVELAVDRWLGRIGAIGLGANVNYPPRYALLVYLRLLASVDKHGVASSHAQIAREIVMEDLERFSKLPADSAQEAALALLGARAARRSDLVSDAWLATVLDDQRSDGTWLGEIFASEPNRGRRVTGYSSVTLTTALCYDALATEAEHSRRNS